MKDKEMNYFFNLIKYPQKCLLVKTFISLNLNLFYET